MSFVNLVSGGLDSTLVGLMAKEEGVEHFPLFVDFGQRAARREWESCKFVHKNLGLPKPVRMDLSGFGGVIASGLTKSELNIKNDAFTPGRNLMFLLMGSAYAYQLGSTSVAIGLLAEEYSLFPDQKRLFVETAEVAISVAMGWRVKVLTPLIEFGKADVIRLAQTRGISGTYSCHAGSLDPCGECIACVEFGLDKEE